MNPICKHGGGGDDDAFSVSGSKWAGAVSQTFTCSSKLVSYFKSEFKEILRSVSDTKTRWLGLCVTRNYKESPKSERKLNIIETGVSNIHVPNY